MDTVKITLPENYHPEKAKVRASVLWLLAKAYHNKVPSDLRDPCYQDHGEDRLKPQLVHALANADLYCLALANIYADPNHHGLNHQGVIQLLGRKGVDLGRLDQLTETILVQTAPLRLQAHLAVIEGILRLYVKEVLIPEKVLEVVRRFSPESDMPQSAEEAALLWVNKSCLKLRHHIETELGLWHASTCGTDQQPQRVPVLPVIQDLSELSNGISLAGLVSFYCPNSIFWEDLRSCEGLSDAIYHLLLVREFCQQWEVSCLSLEDLLYLEAPLRPNALALLADLLYLFEIRPAPCVVRPGIQPTPPPPVVPAAGINGSSRSHASEVRPIPDLRSPSPQPQQQQQQSNGKPAAGRPSSGESRSRKSETCGLRRTFSAHLAERPKHIPTSAVDIPKRLPSPKMESASPLASSPSYSQTDHTPPSRKSPVWVEEFRLHPPDRTITSFADLSKNRGTNALNLVSYPAPCDQAVIQDHLRPRSEEDQLAVGIQRLQPGAAGHFYLHNNEHQPPQWGTPYPPFLHYPPPYPSQPAGFALHPMPNPSAYYNNLYHPPLTYSPVPPHMEPQPPITSRVSVPDDEEPEFARPSKLLLSSSPPSKPVLGKTFRVTRPKVLTPSPPPLQANTPSPSSEDKGFYVALEEGDTPRKPKPKLKPKNLKVRSSQQSPQYEHPPPMPRTPSPNNLVSSPDEGRGFVVGAELVEPDPQSELEMTRKKEMIMVMSLRRRAEQEARRAGKEQANANQRERERQKKELQERKKEEERQRRQAILEQYRQKKALQQEAESSEAPPAPRPRPKSRSGSRPRPKTIHLGGSSPSLDTASVQSLELPGPTRPRAVPASPASLPLSLHHAAGSDAGSDSCSLPPTSEYTGPKLFVKPSSKSNRGIVTNAINTVLAGAVNADTKRKVLQEMGHSDSKHFLILFRDGGCQFRGLYSYNPETEEVAKLYGVGPRSISQSMMDRFFKYNSGSKGFSAIQTKHLTVTIDAITIQNTLWGAARRQPPSR